MGLPLLVPDNEHCVFAGRFTKGTAKLKADLESSGFNPLEVNKKKKYRFMVHLQGFEPYVTQ